MSMCLCEGSCDRGTYIQQILILENSKNLKLFLGGHYTCSNLKRTDINFISEAGHKKMTTRAVYFPKKGKDSKKS